MKQATKQTKESRYQAYLPGKDGIIHYTAAENLVWQKLYTRQISLIQNLACAEFWQGIDKLGLAADKIPQPSEVSQKLLELTGWVVDPVPALIDFQKFFSLLALKRFPAASFIRRMADLDYLPEPDIFHEIFGHCPALTNPHFAAFTQEVGKFGLGLNQEDRVMLARLYWFTVEFGLIATDAGLRIYGAGILSSKAESEYALYSELPLRKPFDLLAVLRTPYRYDELQKIYFIIDSFEQLYNMVNGSKLTAAFAKAKSLGLLPSLYTKIKNSEHSHECN